MVSKKPKVKTQRTKVVCLSHKEDADGISSAALIREAFGGDTILEDYPGLMDALEKIKNDEKIKQLEKLKVKLIHDINECTTVQVYNAYKSKLSEHASFVAACAAITDYMEDRPLGAKLLQIYDRQFALINATVLTFNIVGHQKDPDYLLYLVEEISESKYPHEIPNTFEFAQIQVEKLASMVGKVKKSMKMMKNLAYMEVLDAGASGAVNFVLGLSGKDVGVAYKERVDHGIYAVSVRGSKACKIHLGRIVNPLATKLGGSGGGHDRACGAVIPKPKIKQFLKEFNATIS